MSMGLAVGAHLVLFQSQACAYMEFAEVDAVQNAILLDGTELKERLLKVSQPRPFNNVLLKQALHTLMH